MITATKPTTVDFDFEGQEHEPEKSTALPFAQMINPRLGVQGLKPFGLAITFENIDEVGFRPSPSWSIEEYTFGSGDRVQIAITKAPRILVVRRGPIGIKERQGGKIVGRLAEHYDTYINNRAKYKTFTRHIIFLTDEEGKFLHDLPLQLTLNGASGATFGEAYNFTKKGHGKSGFCMELEKAYADRRKQPVKQKGQLFYAHGIFCPKIEAVEKGSGNNKAFVATTTDFEHPTAENLEKYLLSSSGEQSETIRVTFERFEGFGWEKPKSSEAAQEEEPGAEEYEEDYPF